MKPADYKKFFFDSETVIRSVDVATRKNLSRLGASVRRNALSSLKSMPENKHSSPGSAPFTHTSARRKRINKRRKSEGKDPLPAKSFFKGLRYLLFSYDADKRSVIIGPASNRVRSITIPQILEEGLLDIAQRPFMGPALNKTKKEIPSVWAGSVKP